MSKPLPTYTTKITHIIHKKKHLKRTRPTSLVQNLKNKVKITNPHNTTHTKQTKKKNPKHPKHITTQTHKIISKNKRQRHKACPNPPIQTFFLHFLILLSGDIETNPGPMPNILQTHPPTHRNRCKIYFIECTIKLQPEYQHLAKQFSPIINITHPQHQDTITTYPYLSRYIYRNQHHPPPQILYALIITLSPLRETCNHLLIQTPVPDWTTTMLGRMTSLQNPPERHILTTHPYTQFLQTNQNIINPPNTIHKELYDYIKQSNTPPTIQTMSDKFPFLPKQLLIETLKCNDPLPEYLHPPPPPIATTLHPQENHTTNHNTHIITWNASSLNTALPNLHQLISNTPNKPAIITIQETKLTATKSTKYNQNQFPQYKLIFNNTHALTRCMQQRMAYTPTRGGLLTLINKEYTYPGNVSKIPTPAAISPYLQIIEIHNQPLQPWLIIHLYMPSHEEDIGSIPLIKQNITQQSINHPNHIHILCGDFNKDIALIGRQNGYDMTPPQAEDIEWRTFTENLQLTYIHTNSLYSRQGGHNYNQTSLIDGYYIKTSNNDLYTSTTNNDHNLNSDHSPVTLHIPPNMLLVRHPPPTTDKPPRILNPIPQENIEKFKTEFFEENTLQLNHITNTLNQDQLTDEQWQTTCTKFNHLIQKISDKIQDTCSAPPFPVLTNRTSQ